jgi:rSAM/selenodomain-associated transferase 2
LTWAFQKATLDHPPGEKGPLFWTMSQKISVIIPVLNEGDVLTQTLTVLQPLRARGHELVVVDGGSKEDSLMQSQLLADRVIHGLKGRSRQMNAGAIIASGEIFLFLHADTLLPDGADNLIISNMGKRRRIWGHFDVRLSGKHPLFRIIEFLLNWRSRLTGIATGDQGIFIKRETFQCVGGFPEIDLMEDISLSKILKRVGPPLCLWQRVVTSSRRWERNGIIQTVLLMWYLRLAYFLGANPQDLASLYGKSKPS